MDILNTSIMDILLWWNNRPAGEALIIWFAFCAAITAVYQLFVYTVRHNERKRLLIIVENTAIEYRTNHR